MAIIVASAKRKVNTLSLRLAACLLALPMLCAPAHSQVTVVQTCERSFQLSASSGACTFASPVGAGHFLVIFGTYGIGFGTPTPTDTLSLSFTCPNTTGNLQIGDVSTNRLTSCYASTGGSSGADTITYTHQSFNDDVYFVAVEYAITGGSFDAFANTEQNGAGTSASQNLTVTGTNGDIFGFFMWAGKAVNPALTMTGFTIDFQNNNAIAQGAFTPSCCATTAAGLIVGHKHFTGSGVKSLSAQSGSTAGLQWFDAAFAFDDTNLQTRNHAGVF